MLQRERFAVELRASKRKATIAAKRLKLTKTKAMASAAV